MINIKTIYSSHKSWIILVIFSLLLFLIPYILLLFLGEYFPFLTHPDILKEWFQSFGNWLIVAYIFLSIVVIVIPPLPNEIVMFVGGMLFPFSEALLYSLIVRIAGSSINYWLGTKIRKGLYIRFITKKEQEKIVKYTELLGWQAVFISRFLPSTDTDLIAYVAGIVKMKYVLFIIVSFLGMLVPVSYTIFLGGSLLNKNLFFILLGIYIIGSLLVPLVIAKFLKKNLKKT